MLINGKWRLNSNHSIWRRFAVFVLLGATLNYKPPANSQETEINQQQPHLQTTQSISEQAQEAESEELTPSIIIREESPLEANKETKKPSVLESADKMIERSVMPLTNWMEQKIQGSNIIKPSPYRNEKDSQASTEPSGISMRQAIVQAMNTYPGTVLSSAIKEGGEKQAYQIKILSKEGVIRIIEVPAHVALPKQYSD